MGNVKFGELFDFAPRSKMKAGEGLKEGKYPFYSSSAVLSKRTNRALYSQEALIIGTGGSANIHYGNGPFATSADCLVAVRKRDDFNLKYVYYYLLGRMELLSQGFKGVALKHIHKSYIDQLDIPLYPIKLQNEIVAVLDKAFAVLQSKRQMLRLLKELPRSLFLQMFEELVFQKKKRVRLASVIDGFESGKNQKTLKQPRSNSDEWAVLSQTSISKGVFDPKQNKLLVASEPEKERVVVRAGDLLFARSNTPELVGTTAYVFEAEEKLLMPYAIFKIKYKGSRALGVYLYYLFNDVNFRNEIMRFVRGTIKSMSCISQENLEQLEIPFPSLELQENFYTMVIAVREREVICQESLGQFEKFYSSILHDIFDFRYDIDFEAELEMLLGKVDLEKRENDFSIFSRNRQFLKILIDRINEHDFENQELYDRAVRVLMHYLKIEKIRQVYRETGIKLVLA